MTTVHEEVIDIGALQDLFDEQLRMDALAVYKDMQSPAVMRIRPDTNEPASFRLLGLRCSRMSSARVQLKEQMVALAEFRLPLDTEPQRNSLRAGVRRALESCVRVLESTDAKETNDLVAENAEAMSHSIGAMSRLLENRIPDLARELAEASLRATQIAQNVDAIAREMRQAYEQIRAEIARTGPRVSAGQTDVAQESQSNSMSNSR